MRAMPPSKADAPLALTSASDTTDGSTNCCQSADCRSGCTQHCAAAIAIAAIQDALIPRTGLLRPIQPGPVAPAPPHQLDRKSVMVGQRVSVSVDLAGRRLIKQINT